MSAHNHEHHEHEHEPDDCSHDHEHKSHHHHSKWTNLVASSVMIPSGILLGSYGLVAAGIHNELDGPIHGLRDKAESAKDPRIRFKYRMKAGMFILGGAVVTHLVERVIPAGSVRLATPIIFGAETAMNVSNSAIHIRSKSTSQDTRMGLLHNLTDSASSLAATVMTGAAVITHSTSAVAERAVGYGHIGLMSAIGVKTIWGAVKSYRQETTPEVTQTPS